METAGEISGKTLLCLQSWAGRTETPVTVLRRTPKRTVIRLEADCLKGKAGAELYVPHYALRVLPVRQEG